MASLELLDSANDLHSNPQATATFPLTSSSTAIGRDFLGLPDKRVSRKQLVIDLLPGGFTSVTRTGPTRVSTRHPGSHVSS